MKTSLFDQVIFGPIRSRRLGLSLGVNLLPTESKLCNFNCIYCECGWNGRAEGASKLRFNSREVVRTLLAAKLQEMVAAGEAPDVITFAGNGEPTMHPDFEAIIDDTLATRDKLCPQARVSVLSNATLIDRDSVRRALLRVDNNILKLDSAFDATVQLIDAPQGNYTVAHTVEQMQRFEGRFILQTMFLRGLYKGQCVDNTTPEEVAAWLDLVRRTAPSQVMIYTIDRATPAEGLEKVSVPDLQQIATQVEALGIPCQVSGASASAPIALSASQASSSKSIND